MNTRIAFLAPLALIAPLAGASITGVSGNTTWLGVAPPACTSGVLTGSNAYAWNEQQAVSLTLNADMVNWGPSNAAIAGTVSGVYDSHFIHFEDFSGAIYAGSVTFSGPIDAVIFTPLNLDNSDAPAGAFGTVYPTTYPFRGLNIQSSFFASGNTLSFNFATAMPTPDMIQVRVLTRVPTPGAAGLLGLGGLLAARRRR